MLIDALNGMYVTVIYSIGVGYLFRRQSIFSAIDDHYRIVWNLLLLSFKAEAIHVQMVHMHTLSNMLHATSIIKFYVLMHTY